MESEPIIGNSSEQNTSTTAETKQCRYCAEHIHPAAKICRFCQRDLFPVSESAPRTSLGKVLGVSALVIFGVLALMVIYGSTLGPGDFNGMNDTLYSAISVYGTGLTNDEADRHVDEIMESANVSHSQAERMAVVFVQNRIDPSLWTEMSKTSVKMQRLEDEGVIPPSSP